MSFSLASQRRMASELRHGWWVSLLVVGCALMQATAARGQPIVAAFERFHGGEQSGESIVAGGELLLNELNCVACHAPPEGWRERLQGRGRISLAEVGSRLPAETMRAFVIDPHTFKPGTTMPAIPMGDAVERDALAAFLGSLRSTATKRTYPAGDATRGQAVFERVGCVACHAPGSARTTYPSVPIALAAHMDRAALTEFLLDPLQTRPAGRMPATELSEAEAADLAAFLSPGKSFPNPAALANIAVGRTAFARLGCAACHDTGQPQPDRAALPLAQLREGRGCLSEKPEANAPHFNLSRRQVSALSTAIAAIKTTPVPASLTAERGVDTIFKQLNCYACHAWRGKGGVESVRATHFATADGASESLGELGQLPPKLDHSGRKLTPEWLEKILWGSGGGVRPYLAVRMPRFGRESGAPLIPLLDEACRPAKPESIDTSGSKGHQRSATGRTLMGSGNGGLGCVACHGIRDREPMGVRAINLTHTVQRLRPEYFKALLLDPQTIQPGTIMPPLLAGRKNAEREVESLWTYLKELDQNPRVPEGLGTPDSFELKPEVEGRPIVFRTFLSGAGTHAIAVGFPARVHVAFDAFEVRWALVWRGRFLDALANWEERTMPPVSPLGDDSRMLERAMPFAVLRSPNEAWPAAIGSAANYEFKGYRLGTDGVPTFHYRIAGLDVEDVIRPEPEGTALRRVITVRGGTGDRGTWYFRGVGSSVPIPLEWREGVAVIEERITF
jgi:cytochrome c2